MGRTYANLHTHTEFSLLDGMSDIVGFWARIAALHLPGAAITDHGSMGGVAQWYREARRRDLLPMIGMEAYFVPTVAVQDRVLYHLTLLATSLQGYRNLLALTARAAQAYYYKPRVDWEMLATYREGLFALTGCLNGYLPKLLQAEDAAGVDAYYQRMTAIFGDQWAIEIQDHALPEEQALLPRLMDLHRRWGVPIVATADSHYTDCGDQRPHQILIAVQTHHGDLETLADSGLGGFSGDHAYHLPSAEEMAARFPAEALAFSVDLLERSQYRIPELDQTQYVFPAFGPNEAEMLQERTEAALATRTASLAAAQAQAYQARAQLELETIQRMGFAGYFLVVQDFIQWAKTHGIPMGPGRGSVGGSLVAYLLGITETDPLQHDMLFERFLNPDRISNPDIDIDVSESQRARLVQYAQERYGVDCVAHIGTYSTFQPKAVLKDVARVLGVEFAVANQFSQLLPDKATWEEIRAAPQVQAFVAEHPIYAEVLAVAEKLSGKRRHAGVHAAGIVIAPRPIWEYCPVRWEDGAWITQWDMHEIESIGLVKMDFLGLRTLDVIHGTLERLGLAETWDWESVPLDDPEVLQDLARGESVGIFQFESAAAQDLLRAIQVSSFEDIVAATALNRPGPLDAKDDQGLSMAEHYWRRKHGLEPTTYLDPRLEPILRATYGVITYQEQVMTVARTVAGYAMGESDHLRKIIGKKLMEEMGPERTRFVAGCVAQGMAPETAHALFDQIETAGNYLFNRSHSVEYSYLSYRCAYLKHYFPAHYLAAALTTTQDDPDRTRKYLAEAERLGIHFAPPYLDAAGTTYQADWDGQTIYCPLTAVKGVGQAVAEEILAHRTRHPFTSLLDCLERLGIPSQAWEALAKVGALDRWVPDRGALVAAWPELFPLWRRWFQRQRELVTKPPKQLEKVLANQAQKWAAIVAQVTALAERPRPTEPPLQWGYWEADLLGMPISVHPEAWLERYSRRSERLGDAFVHAALDSKVRGLAVVSHLETRTVQNGTMALGTLRSGGVTIPFVVYARAYPAMAEVLKPWHIIDGYGAVSAYRGERQLVLWQCTVPRRAIFCGTSA